MAGGMANKNLSELSFGVIGVAGSGVLKSRTSRVVSEIRGSLDSVKLPEGKKDRNCHLDLLLNLRMECYATPWPLWRESRNFAPFCSA